MYEKSVKIIVHREVDIDHILQELEDYIDYEKEFTTEGNAVVVVAKPFVKDY